VSKWRGWRVRGGRARARSALDPGLQTSPEGRFATHLAARGWRGARTRGRARERLIQRHCRRAPSAGPDGGLWDGLNAHVCQRTRGWIAARPDDYAAAPVPSCAPDLNPEERCSRHATHGPLNAPPGDLDELLAQARREFRRLGG
jgi:hypothetical protein